MDQSRPRSQNCALGLGVAVNIVDAAPTQDETNRNPEKRAGDPRSRTLELAPLHHPQTMTCRPAFWSW